MSFKVTEIPADPLMAVCRQTELRRLRHQQSGEHAEAEGRPHVGVTSAPNVCLLAHLSLIF